MRRVLKSAGCVALALSFGTLALLGAGRASDPVTPDALPEVRALLAMFHEVSGRHLLTGQHNYPNVKSRNSEFAATYTGKTPVIWGTDFGFAKPDDTDSYLARPDIVQEAIRQHRMGAIVAICWHAVPPTADEPVTFRAAPGGDPAKLASVQGKLLDEQFRDVLTPGTPLHEKWCAQVDAIAVFLKQLEAARVPVLWRPYHEMNGDWFWWGGRSGEYSTERLYRQIFDRLVHHHQLKNLIWVWSVDRIDNHPEREHAKFFPGLEFVDLLALDVYGNDFAQSYYDSLVALSGGKPLVLAEVGNPPSLDILTQQPKWAYYMTWAGMVRNTPVKTYDALLEDPRVLGLEDAAYAQAIAAYRAACGLPELLIAPKPADFAGTWILDPEKSELGRWGAGFAPARLEITRAAGAITIRTTRIVEYADDEVTEEKLTLDGAESRTAFMDSPRITTARLSTDATRLLMNSTVSLAWGPPGSSMTVTDAWTVNRRGDQLTIHRTSTSFMGEQKMTLVFDRR